MTKLWQFYKHLLRQNTAWLRGITRWAIVCAGAGVLVAAVAPELLTKLQRFLDEIFREILGGEKVILDFRSTLLIFQNNFTVSVLLLFLGIFFGILPLLSVGLNFFILGFLLGIFLFSANGLGIGVFLLSVLPHGILEIPALLIAAAFGLRLGLSYLPMGDLPKGKRTRNFKNALKQNFQVLPLLAGMFFAAAVIEIFVTGQVVAWILE